MQIDRTVQPIARSVGLFTTTIVGGVPQYKQVSTLQRGVDIVIATPGRVEDLIEQGRLDLSEVFVDRARRGRPHVRPGLPRAGAAHPRRDQGGRPEAAVLRHPRQGRCRRSSKQYLDGPRGPRGRRRGPGVVDHRPPRAPHRAARQVPHHRGARPAGEQDAHLRPHPRLRRAARRPARGRRDSRRRACTATSTSRAARATSRC